MTTTSRALDWSIHLVYYTIADGATREGTSHPFQDEQAPARRFTRVRQDTHGHARSLVFLRLLPEDRRIEGDRAIQINDRSIRPHDLVFDRRRLLPGVNTRH